MVTSSTILLLPDIEVEYAVRGLTQESAELASRVLQENHDSHDIIFNNLGLHSE